MADGGCLKVLDGTQLSDFDFSLPDDFSGDINGVQLLDFAHSRVSQCHYSLPLPDFLKSLALQRLNFDISGKKLDRDEAQRLLADYVSAIADQLKGSVCFLIFFLKLKVPGLFLMGFIG